MTDYLHTMYQSDDEEIDAPISDVMPDRGIMNMPAMSAAIRRMDQTIANLAKTVEEQKRRIKQQDQHIKHLMHTQRGMAGDLQGVHSSLDNKINMRDWD